MRRVRTNTGYFFDSFKHFKNNLINLITLELTTLDSSKDLNEYLSLRKVNYKSKIPDMKKIGLINYSKPSKNEYEVREEAEKILGVFRNYSTKFVYTNSMSRNKSYSVQEIEDLISKNELLIVRENILILLLSYYDTSDFIRPYLLLIKLIIDKDYKIINDDLLRTILANKKIDILSNEVNPYAYEILDADLKEELRRPISYLKNFLQVGGIIDNKGHFTLDEMIYKEIVSKLDEINFSDYLEQGTKEKSTSRSSADQNEFRKNVLVNYNYKCAITGEPIIFKSMSVSSNKIILLEAAHIIPYSEGGSFSTSNGIALSPEMHKLFDFGLFTFEYIDKELFIKVSKNKDIKDNGVLESIDGKKITVKGPINPDPIAIEYRSKFLL